MRHIAAKKSVILARVRRGHLNQRKGKPANGRHPHRLLHALVDQCYYKLLDLHVSVLGRIPFQIIHFPTDLFKLEQAGGVPLESLVAVIIETDTGHIGKARSRRAAQTLLHGFGRIRELTADIAELGVAQFISVLAEITDHFRQLIATSLATDSKGLKNPTYSGTVLRC